MANSAAHHSALPLPSRHKTHRYTSPSFVKSKEERNDEESGVGRRGKGTAIGRCRHPGVNASWTIQSRQKVASTQSSQSRRNLGSDRPVRRHKRGLRCDCDSVGILIHVSDRQQKAGKMHARVSIGPCRRVSERIRDNSHRRSMVRLKDQWPL